MTHIVPVFDPYMCFFIGWRVLHHVNIRLLGMMPVYLEERAAVGVDDVHGLGVPLVQPTTRPGYGQANKLCTSTMLYFILAFREFEFDC